MFLIWSILSFKLNYLKSLVSLKSSLQRHRKTKHTGPIVSLRFQWIGKKSGVLMGYVGLMNVRYIFCWMTWWLAWKPWWKASRHLWSGFFHMCCNHITVVSLQVLISMSSILIKLFYKFVLGWLWPVYNVRVVQECQKFNATEAQECQYCLTFILTNLRKF